MAGKLTDVSFAGATVEFTGGVPCSVTDFMDDANPIEVQEVEFSGAGMNLNGNMIRYAKPYLIMLSVTVIPGSESERALHTATEEYMLGKHADANARAQWNIEVQCHVTCAAGKYTFLHGTPMSGNFGPSSTAEGKMQGRTYTFAFLDVNYVPIR